MLVMMQEYINAQIITESPGNWFLDKLIFKISHDKENKTKNRKKCSKYHYRVISYLLKIISFMFILQQHAKYMFR